MAILAFISAPFLTLCYGIGMIVTHIKSYSVYEGVRYTHSYYISQFEECKKDFFTCLIATILLYGIPLIAFFTEGWRPSFMIRNKFREEYTIDDSLNFSEAPKSMIESEMRNQLTQMKDSHIENVKDLPEGVFNLLKNDLIYIFDCKEDEILNMSSSRLSYYVLHLTAAYCGKVFSSALENGYFLDFQDENKNRECKFLHTMIGILNKIHPNEFNLYYIPDKTPSGSDADRGICKWEAFMNGKQRKESGRLR